MDEFSEDDFVFTPCGPLGSQIRVFNGHKFHDTFHDMDTALESVKNKMEMEQFFPSLVWMSDHGNWWYIDIDGNELPILSDNEEE